MKTKGIIALLLATFSYGLWGVFSRLISADYQAFSQNYVRNFWIILSLAVYYLINRKKWVPVRKEDIKSLVIWTSSGAFVMVLLFLSFNKLQLGTVYFLFYSTMIIGGVVTGKIYFNEKLTNLKILSIIISVIGLLLVYSNGFSLINLPYILIALISGILIGYWNVTSKIVSSKFSSLQITFMYAIVGFTTSIIGSLILNENIPPLFSISMLWIILFAATSICSTIFLVYGFKRIEGQIGSVIMPTEVIFAILFGYIFFGEVLPTTTLIGGLLIAGASILPNLSKT